MLPQPRSMRDDGDLVGWGMATGIWEALDNHFTVRVALTANGHAEVTCAASDLGTGTYTVMAQVAADLLGLPIENVNVRLGDSTLPQAPVAGGSWTASSVANALAVTCEDVRAELLRLAQTAPGSPLANAGPPDVFWRAEALSASVTRPFRCPSRTRCGAEMLNASNGKRRTPRRKMKNMR